MPSIEEREFNLSSVWGKKIAAANKYYKNWSDKYRTEQLERGYYGHQWENEGDLYDDRYVFNMIFSSIDVKTPSLLFQRPIFSIAPRPSKLDFNPEGAYERARLREDALNFFAKYDVVGLADSVSLAILDAFFRFGIIEVGFSAEWIDNPNAGQPVLKEDETPYIDEDGEVVRQPKRIPKKERLYTKRIHSQRFRVGELDTQKLTQCNWCGYWEYFRKADLQSNDLFKNTKGIPTYGRIDHDGLISTNDEALSDETQVMLDESSDIAKVWKIWDLRSMRKFYLAEPGFVPIYETKFKCLPLFPLKFRDRLSGFYPLPPVFNWIHPQREINDVREAARIHRKRYNRKYVAHEESFKEGELEKLQTGGDGFIAKSAAPLGVPPILPVPDAPMNTSHREMLVMSREDFNIISGTSAEMRGEASDDVTATQAQITNQRAQVRESRDRTIVALFLSAIGKEILLQAKEKLTLPFWIKISKSEEETFGEIEEITDTWVQITSEDFGDEDFDISVNITSLSPVENEEEKRKLLEFLSIISNFPQTGLSPVLIREIADKVGYRNEKSIKILQQLAQMQLAGLIEQLQGLNAQQGQSENQIAQRTVAQASPNTQEQIRNQIANQSQ